MDDYPSSLSWTHGDSEHRLLFLLCLASTKVKICVLDFSIMGCHGESISSHESSHTDITVSHNTHLLMITSALMRASMMH